MVTGLDVVDASLSELGADGLVKGETDSERVFTLIIAAVRHRDGDIFR